MMVHPTQLADLTRQHQDEVRRSVATIRSRRRLRKAMAAALFVEPSVFVRRPAAPVPPTAIVPAPRDGTVAAHDLEHETDDAPTLAGNGAAR